VVSDWQARPVAALEERLERIAELNPRLHAFLSIDTAGARQAAQDAETRRLNNRPLSPIDGMPIGIKANIAVAGWHFHAGIGAWRQHIAGADAPCVARLREGGAVLLGLLNMDEAALGDTTDNPFFGRTENPLQPGFTAGGSSGGAAAAVAAGMCEAALGTDTLGSVRIPASYCGIFGHKMPPGAISPTGIVPLAPAFDSVGILAGSAARAACVRRWLGGCTAAAPGGDFGPVGIFLPDGAEIDPAVSEAFGGVVEKARRLGFALHPLPNLAHPLRNIAKAALLAVVTEAAALHAEERATNPAGFSERFHAMLDWALAQPPARRQAARALLAETAAQIRQSFAAHGAVLMPTTPNAAFAFGADRPRNVAAFTTLANVAGLAATAFPAGGSETAPVSVQAVGADEAKCLFLAEALGQVGRFGAHGPQPGPTG
jgi:aspartyl-tRNA(Asn)/glutamyl-tRNA(Gln) amidotransferase subunit A